MLLSMERKAKRSKSEMKKKIHMAMKKANPALEVPVAPEVTVAQVEIQTIPTQARMTVMKTMTVNITAICSSTDLLDSQLEKLSLKDRRTASTNHMIRPYYLFIILVVLINITLG